MAKKPLMSQRAALILFIAIVAGVATGGLLTLAGATTPLCIAGGSTAFLTTLRTLHDVVA